MNRFNLPQEDINVIIRIKDGHTYAVAFGNTVSQRIQALRKLGKWAFTPGLNLTPKDACEMAKSVHATKGKQ